MDPRQLEVLGARPRRDVNDAGALVERDLVPRNDPVHDAGLRRKMVERPGVFETH